MRLEDYRLYGKLCFVSGLTLAVIGILVPLLTGSHLSELVHLGSPFLNFGIVAVILGIMLMIASWILFRSTD